MLRLAVDCNAHAIDVYRRNFRVSSDIARLAVVEEFFDGELGSKLTAAERRVSRELGRPDVLLAGPPCQGHSDLNNSTRRKDPRNLLYLRAVRAAEVLRPRAVLIENVPMVRNDSEGVVRQAHAALRRFKYSISDVVLDVRSLGLAQRRRRHLIFATDTTLRARYEPSPVRDVAISEFIADLVNECDRIEHPFCTPAGMTVTNQLRARYLIENDCYDLPDALRPPCHKDKPHSYQSMYGRLRWALPAQTITSGFGSMGQGRFVHPTRPRTITPHEAARLQGFPDFFDFGVVRKRTELQQMIGNAVPPQVAEAILTHWLQHRAGESEAA